MTEKQQALYEALRAFNENMDQEWKIVVDATNKLSEAITTKQESYDASFPPELEREFDKPANRTAWIYDRLESAAKTRRNTSKRIRKALGYNG